MKTVLSMIAVASLAFGTATAAHAQDGEFPVRGFETGDAPDEEEKDEAPEADEPEKDRGPIRKPVDLEDPDELEPEEEEAEEEEEDEGRKPITKKAESSRALEEVKSGTDRSIYVVQERSYSKSKAIEITPFFFTKINPKFVGYLGGGISAAFHFKENFGLEFVTAIPGPLFNSFYSNLVTEVFQYESLTPEEVDLKRMKYFGALSLNFSALYGKWNLYGLLLDYDFYAHGGVGLVTLEETCAPPGQGDCGQALTGTGRGLRSPDSGRDRLKVTGNLGFGLRVYFMNFLGFRIELRDIVYADRDVEAGQTTSDIRNELMVFLGASFLIHPF